MAAGIEYTITERASVDSSQHVAFLPRPGIFSWRPSHGITPLLA
jgi:hypothetical protein